MNKLLTKFQPDTWLTATWEEYQQLIAEPEFQKAKFYYDNGQLRIEMVPLVTIMLVITRLLSLPLAFFAGLKIF